MDIRIEIPNTEIAEKTNLGIDTVKRAFKGQNVTIDTAFKITKVVAEICRKYDKEPIHVEDLFFNRDKTPKTVLAEHLFKREPEGVA